MQIPITKNGTTTLKTAGKYCTGDIDVTVDVDTFWDVYQQKGKRTAYNCAFYGSWWEGDRFDPKYDIRPVEYANSMFADSRVRKDLRTILTKNGVVLDFSQANSFVGTFARSWFTGIGVCDFCGGLSNGFLNTFLDCEYLQTIEKLKLKSTGQQTFNHTFDGCKALKEIRFEGTINRSIDLRWSHQLSKESVLSLVGALGMGDSFDATPLTQKVSISTTTREKFTDEEWAELIAPYIDTWVFVVGFG